MLYNSLTDKTVGGGGGGGGNLLNCNGLGGLTYMIYLTVMRQHVPRPYPRTGTPKPPQTPPQTHPRPHPSPRQKVHPRLYRPFWDGCGGISIIEFWAAGNQGRTVYFGDVERVALMVSRRAMAKTHSNYLINKHTTMIRAVYNRLIALELIVKNPIITAKFPKPDAPKWGISDLQSY